MRRPTHMLLAATAQALGCEPGCCCAKSFLPVKGSAQVSQAAWAGGQTPCSRESPEYGCDQQGWFRCPYVSRSQRWTCSAGIALMTLRLPFSASPLVGLWHVKLNHCGASGPNLNTALGCSASAWLGEASMTLGYSTGYRIHSIPPDRMGLGWGRESL